MWLVVLKPSHGSKYKHNVYVICFTLNSVLVFNCISSLNIQHFLWIFSLWLWPPTAYAQLLSLYHLRLLCMRRLQQSHLPAFAHCLVFLLYFIRLLFIVGLETLRHHMGFGKKASYWTPLVSHLLCGFWRRDFRQYPGLEKTSFVLYLQSGSPLFYLSDVIYSKVSERFETFSHSFLVRESGGWGLDVSPGRWHAATGNHLHTSDMWVWCCRMVSDESEISPRQNSPHLFFD